MSEHNAKNTYMFKLADHHLRNRGKMWEKQKENETAAAKTKRTTTKLKLELSKNVGVLQATDLLKTQNIHIVMHTHTHTHTHACTDLWQQL